MDAENEIAALLETWNESLAAGDPAKVVALYAEDAILLPTMSARVRHGRPEIRDYFEHAVAIGLRGAIVDQNIRVLGEVAINSGLYDFAVYDSGANPDQRARFTFVYRRCETGWLIIEHHSSFLPAQG